MPKLHLSVDHNLGQEEAKKRLAGLIAQSRAQFANHVSEVAEAWEGYTDIFSFRTMGFSISGRLIIEPSQAHIELQFPFAALPFKGRVERDLLERTRKLLA